jgi:hypothetical protein
MLSVSAIDVRARVVARSASSTSTRRQQALVKRINQGALRFYRTFIRQSVRATATVDCELNDLLEELLLAVDCLADPRYMRHNLVIVMQIAADIEQELVLLNVSSNIVIAWSRLHSDLGTLAKMNGIKWSDAVITDALIAASRKLSPDQIVARRRANAVIMLRRSSADTSGTAPGRPRFAPARTMG